MMLTANLMSAAINPDYNFACATDFDYTTQTKTVAANIYNTHPQNPPRFLIANGDFAYDNKASSALDSAAYLESSKNVLRGDI
jgi:hypothetical protein